MSSADDLAAAYSLRYNQLRVRAGRAGVRAWRDLGSYDEADIPALQDAVLPILAGAQRLTVSLADAYVAHAVAQETGHPTSPVGLDPAQYTTAALRGVPVEEVYHRPFVEVWSALKGGTPWAAAVDSGAVRLLGLISSDMALTQRAASVGAMGLQSVPAHLRVTDGDACDYCLLATTKIYRSGELQPLHTNCGCTVRPYYGPVGKAGIVNPGLLSELKRSGAAGDLSLQQGARRARKSSREAWARGQRARSEITRETDRARRLRLDERATRWESRSVAQAKRAGKFDAQLAERRATRKLPAAEQYAREVAVHEHGELGPVLTRAGDHFTSL